MADSALKQAFPARPHAISTDIDLSSVYISWLIEGGAWDLAWRDLLFGSPISFRILSLPLSQLPDEEVDQGACQQWQGSAQ